MNQSRATAFDTAEYAQAGRLPGHAYRLLGRTNLTVSSVGFGTYRVHSAVPTHCLSLRTALLAGCNLIDTSTNYSDGASEAALGNTLRALFSEGKLRREELVVISKVGYVQGKNLTAALARVAAGEGYPEMVEYGEGCWHCIHPEFIRDQVAASLQRTGLDCLDGYLLHNPEYFLMHRENNSSGETVEASKELFYGRIAKAFACLEELVAQGKISAYGVSSNTLGGPADQLTSTSLSRFWEIAEGLGTKHHFSIVQLPLNLLESGPLLCANTGKNSSETALQFAERVGLGVLTNRPLNAFYQDRLVRLADYAYTERGERVDLKLEDISKSLNAWLPDSLRGETLSRKAMASLIGSRGVSCVLVGMRRPEFVEDTLGAAAMIDEPVLPGAFSIFS